MNSRYDLEDEEKTDYKDEYTKLSKSALMQESRIFNDAKLKHKKCTELLCKIIFLLNQGESFAPSEKTEMFFNVTKLFMNPNEKLRRIIYIFIKELKADENEVFIVTSCLSKDMISDNDTYKANSLRVLSKIVDQSNLQSIERQLKNSLVDQSSLVKASALVSGLHLFKKHPEMVKKLVGDVQTILMGPEDLQYHALLLLHEIKKDDPMAILKVISQLTAKNKNFSNKHAKCQLIRYIKEILMNASLDAHTLQSFIQYLFDCLSKTNDFVTFEAAKSLCELSEVYKIDLETVFNTLLTFVNNGNAVQKFAALKVLNKLAKKNPSLVATCSSDLEPLINDSNSSVASMAISTLLTCTQTNVSKLIAQIQTYLPDMGDDFKIEITHSFYTLFKRIPSKSSELIKFLHTILQGEGSKSWKEAIVETLMKIGVEGTKKDTEEILHCLVEFIEDCQFDYLATHILDFVGEQAPKTSSPSLYIRYIYNRIILDKPSVRAAAVSSLGNIGHKIEDLRQQIIGLLKHCLHDEDEEVSARAQLFLNLLESREAEADQMRDLVFGELEFDVEELEAFILENRDEEELDFSTLTSVDPSAQNAMLSSVTTPVEEVASTVSPQVKKEEIKAPEPAAQEDLSEVEQKVGEAVLISSEIEDVNDSNAEYQVKVRKHFTESYTVLVLSITNTIEEHRLREVRAINSPGASPVVNIEGGEEVDSISYGETKQHTIWFVNESQKFDVKLTLSLKIEEVDEDGNVESDYNDTYQIDPIKIKTSDFMIRQPIPVGSFNEAWTKISNSPTFVEDQQIFSIGSSPENGLKAAATDVINFFGMETCENSSNVDNTAKSHTLSLAGTLLVNGSGKFPVLAKALIGFKAEYGCVLKIAIRSTNPEAINLVTSCIQ